MQNRNSLLGLLAAIALGAVIAFGFQVFTGTAQQSDPIATEEVAISFDEMEEVTIVPDGPDATPGIMDDDEVVVLDEPGLQTEDDEIMLDEGPVPTAAPIPPAPQPATLSDSAQTIALEDFSSSAALEGWSFAQIEEEPMEAPAWEVRETDTVQQMLVAPDNSAAFNFANDTMAIAPETLAGDGEVTVSARTSSASKMGLVLGYQNPDNFVALVFGAESAVGMSGKGVNLVQVVDGKATVLAFNENVVMEPDRWYTLRLDVAGNEISASVDGGKPLTFTLTTPLAGSSVGVYAGFEGFVFFDNMRISQK